MSPRTVDNLNESLTHFYFVQHIGLEIIASEILLLILSKTTSHLLRKLFVIRVNLIAIIIVIMGTDYIYIVILTK